MNKDNVRRFLQKSVKILVGDVVDLSVVGKNCSKAIP
jgi:hypothetical protein